MTVKIAIIAMPHSMSSKVMAAFDAAGFELGDVDRRVDEGYPAGRLELWALAQLTSGKSKVDPPERRYWPQMDLSKVQVAKAMPAWVPILKEHGFNYWIGCSRNGLRHGLADMGFELDEIVEATKEIDARAIWDRAIAARAPRRGRPPKQRGEGLENVSARAAQLADQHPESQAHEDAGLYGQAREHQS